MTKEDLSFFFKNKNVLVLSVSQNNIPWVSTLNFAEDENLNLYFISKKDSKHSQIININPNVSVAIYDHNSDPEAVKVGVQISGTCKIVSNPLEIKEAYRIFKNKFPTTKLDPKEILQIAFTSAFYKITPKYIKYFNNSMKIKESEFSL